MKLLKLFLFLFWYSPQLYKVLFKKHTYSCVAELCLGCSLQNLGAVWEAQFLQEHSSCAAAV